MPESTLTWTIDDAGNFEEIFDFYHNYCNLGAGEVLCVENGEADTIYADLKGVIAGATALINALAPYVEKEEEQKKPKKGKK